MIGYIRKVWNSLRNYNIAEALSRLLEDLIKSATNSGNIVIKLLLFPLIVIAAILLLIALAIKNVFTSFGRLMALIISEIEFHVAKLAQASSELKDDWAAITDFSVDILRYLYSKIFNDTVNFHSSNSLPNFFFKNSFRWILWLLINMVVAGWLVGTIGILLYGAIGHSLIRILAGLVSLFVPPLIQRMIRVLYKKPNIPST